MTAWQKLRPMQEDKIRVLYVDDEEFNLSSFKASFRRNFHIHTAISGPEAIEILKEHTFDIIITDQRMPEMTGIQLLEYMLKNYPEPIRILLTGYSDIQAVIDAINKGQVYRYLTKPWNEDEIRQTVLACYEVLSLRRKNQELLVELEKANKQLEFMIRQKLLS
jgi:response regulator RpfG family c-di-GMP phosphodiesterase